MSELNRIKEMAPCYIYEESGIRSACRELKSKLPGFDFLYSIKSNPFEPVVRTIADEGIGADAASANEVIKSLDCGIAAENIYYSAPGKSERDLRNTFGKCVLVADSLNEIKLIQKIAAEKGVKERIGIRVHPLFAMGGGAAGASKFGIDLEQMDELINTAAACPDVEITGMHVHLMSQILNADIIGQYYQDVFDTAEELKEKLGCSMEFIDFGSGIGTVYDSAKEKPVDLEKLHAATVSMLDRNEKGLKAHLMIETGRFLVCHAGRYYTSVVDIKESHGTKYVVVSNGMNGFMRPSMVNFVRLIAGDAEVSMKEPLYTNDHAFEISVLNDTNEQEKVVIAGNLCTALDVVASGITVNKAEIGDIVEVTNAGSYAYPLTPHFFSGHDLPGQYLHTVSGEYEKA